MLDSAYCRSNRAVTELVAGVTRYRRRLDQTMSRLTGVSAASGMDAGTNSVKLIRHAQMSCIPARYTDASQGQSSMQCHLKSSLAAGRAIAKLDPVAREVLRVGLYELMDLGLVDHAIGSHVNIVKAMGAPHLAGFVNGVRIGPDVGPVRLSGVPFTVIVAMQAC